MYIFFILLDHAGNNNITGFILWQGSLEENQSVPIGFFLDRDFAVGTFSIERVTSRVIIFLCFEKPVNLRPECHIINYLRAVFN